MASFEAKVTSKGQITLPAQLREGMRINAGDKVVFTQAPDGAYRITAKNRSLADLRGIVRGDAKVSGADIQRLIDDARASRSMIGPTRSATKRPKR